jgi:predicted cupin superfamily sugar epimerase
MAKYYINKLPLLPHPEGGFFKETYRFDVTIDTDIDSVKKQPNQPVQSGTRSIASSIYYLLEGRQVSIFHRLNNADEIWHFYAGSSLTIYSINEAKKKLNEFKLGYELEVGEKLENCRKKRFMVWSKSK